MADTDFDTKAAALLRRRKMADLLQQQSLEGFKPPPIQGRTSILEPLGQMAKAFAGLQMGKETDAAEAENEAARSAEYARLLAEMPKGTAAIPAVAEQAGTDVMGLPSVDPAEGFVAPRPGTAAKPPTGAEMLPWAANIARTGQQGRDLAKFVEQRSMENMLPKALSEYEIANLASVAEDRVARREETRVQNMAMLAQKEAELERLKAKDVLDSTDKEKQRQLLLEVAKIRASTHGEGGSDKYKTTTDVGDQGQRLVQSNGVYHQVLGDGTIDPKPYGGVTTPKTTQEKNVAAAFGSEKTIAQLDSALAAMDKDPNLFSTRKAIGALFPDAGDASATVGGVTPEQGIQRTQIAEMSAQRAHALYGAALTESEQKRAKGFIVNLSDGPKTARWKLEGLKKMEQEFKDRTPAAAQAAAAARTGGAAPAAAAPGGGGWSATVVPKP